MSGSERDDGDVAPVIRLAQRAAPAVAEEAARLGTGIAAGRRDCRQSEPAQAAPDIAGEVEAEAPVLLRGRKQVLVPRSLRLA